MVTKAQEKKWKKEQEERWAEEHKRKEFLLDVIEPFVDEAIKGIKGIIKQKRTYVFGAIPIMAAKLPGESCYSGHVHIIPKDGEVRFEVGRNTVSTLPLGDPELVEKMRKKLLKWRQHCKQKWIKDERRDIKDARAEIKRQEQKIARVNAKIDKYKELFK